MVITYKFKLYKSSRLKSLHKQLNIACWIYNHSIALHRRYYRLYGKGLNSYKLKKHLTKLKKRKLWLYELGSQAGQDVIERIEKAYKLFFESLKKNIKASPPGFKGKRKYRSFTLKQAGWSIEGNKLRIGKQIFKFSRSRELNGLIKTVTLKRDSLGDFYVLICCKVEDHPSKVTSNTSCNGMGLDFGLKNFLTLSNGGIIEAPEPFKENLVALKKIQRTLSFKKKGSRNREKARICLARVHKKVSNLRADFHHKLARNLAKTYDSIFVEDLNLQGMKKVWGRKVSDLGFSSFLLILEHHCNKSGSRLLKIPRFYPSSKTCSVCNSVQENLSLDQRSWVCASCKAEHNRDINAARNIFRVGQDLLKSKNNKVGASTFRGEGIRSTQVPSLC
jgi:putative transposase